MTFPIPDGYPGPNDIDHRMNQARRILEARHVNLQVDAVRLHLELRTMIRVLVATGVLSDEQLEYFFRLVQMEAFEALVLETTPKPRILVPGRDS